MCFKNRNCHTFTTRRPWTDDEEEEEEGECWGGECWGGVLGGGGEGHRAFLFRNHIHYLMKLSQVRALLYPHN